MNIKKNKDGSYDITGVSLGKLNAIANAFSQLQEERFLNKSDKKLSTLQQEVWDNIKNNPDYKKDTKMD